MNAPTPGWYPDPQAPSMMRWWDGDGWTADTYQRAEPDDGWPSGSAAAGPTTPGSTTPGSAPSGSAPPGSRPSGSVVVAVLATDDGQVLAGWWRRAAARAVDTLITWALAVLAGWPQVRIVGRAVAAQLDQAMRAARQGDPAPALGYDDRVLQASAVLVGSWLLVTLGYDLAFLLWRRATPGKLLLGLRLRPWDSARPLTGWLVVRRWLAFQVVAQLSYVGAGYALLDLLWPLRGGRRQTLHDRFAGTVVVRRERR
jgi:uncharacterized RDD family membrane protein YckC